MTMPSMTTTPIAPRASRPSGGEPKGPDRVDPQPRGESERVVADHAHRDGQDAGHQRRGSRYRDRTELQRAGDDAGVHEDDVGHDHERGQAGPHLRGQVGAALGELEVLGDEPATWRGSLGRFFHRRHSPPLLPGSTRRALGGLGPRLTPGARPGPGEPGRILPYSGSAPRGPAAPSGRSRWFELELARANGRNPRRSSRSGRTR